MFAGKTDNVETVFWFSWWLALVVNHPHFLGSYTLLYSDFRHEILKKPKHFWAAVIVPVSLMAYLVYAVYNVRDDLIGYAINVMFFLVGWHYVKQIFGCVIVGAVRQGQIYQRLERWTILMNLFCLWWISLMRGPYSVTDLEYHGVHYNSPVNDEKQIAIAFLCFGISVLLLIAVHVHRYIKTGALPSAMGTIAMVAIYLWFLPAFKHPIFDYMVPFFHSLQYLALAGQFKFNKVAADIGEIQGEVRRKLWLRKFAGYWFGVFVLGLIGFIFIPEVLNGMGLLPAYHRMGTTPFTAIAIVFINIHHYFIDNVIWRASNVEIRKFLFLSDRTQAKASLAQPITNEFPIPEGVQPAH